SKKTVLIDEHRARCEYNNAFRTLQMESLRRKVVGKLETSQKNLIHSKKMAFERIEAEIEDRIAELDEERKRCLSVIDEYDSEEKEHVKRRKTDDKAMEKLRNELNMPLVFYMLSREYLLMDIALAENALKAVNLRQTN
uniref:FLYWCH-type domain-containing protein n=1 Tax=Parascaris univalens TaxID=6257 RepID=A0A915BEK0_PARUN